MNEITWRTEDSSTAHQAVNFLRDRAFESRLSSLRDVAMELLNAVESLKTTSSDSSENRTLRLHEEVRKFETDLICTALVRTGGNQLRAARLLGVKHTTLNAKIKRYGIMAGNGHRDAQEMAA
jgi:DNA-binding NtrC family response regulator